MPCLKYPILALAATGTWKLTNASKKVVFPVPLSPTIASLLPVMISFGEKNFGMNYAIVFLGYSGGAFVGPRIASYIQETTGSFTTAYIVAAILGGIGVGLVALIVYVNKRRAKLA
ncbi:hypothetical protein JCM19046_2748 [Bacillus sp. JCM 19046]|nr:hypothetical protein JCM19046_2748 [Bacillus sp. JCM 19046]